MSNKPTGSGPITLRTPLGDPNAKPQDPAAPAAPAPAIPAPSPSSLGGPPPAPGSVAGSFSVPGVKPGAMSPAPISTAAPRSTAAVPPPSFARPPSVSTMGAPPAKPVSSTVPVRPPSSFSGFGGSSGNVGHSPGSGSGASGSSSGFGSSGSSGGFGSSGSSGGFGSSGSSGSSSSFGSSGSSSSFGSSGSSSSFGSSGSSSGFGSSGSSGSSSGFGSSGSSSGFGSFGSGGAGSGGGGGGSAGSGGNSASPLAKEVLRILGRYLSQMLARQVLDRSAQQIGRPTLQFVAADMPRLVDAIVRDARAFLDPNNVNRLKTELEALLPEAARIRGPLDLEIRVESDIAQARMAAKEICESLGGNRLAVQRAATIVSEITRNMVSYAGGGRVELIPRPKPGAAILIRAADHGPGIKNLSEILGGHYKSRTGLGLGILAAKRLSDHFEIESDTSGTRIVVEVRL